jgi:hypothetical protein
MGVAEIRDWFAGERDLAHGPVGRIGIARDLVAAAET